ncbi:hypothetical protein B5807_12118, partial [Epicoccum nigrum]
MEDLSSEKLRSMELPAPQDTWRSVLNEKIKIRECQDLSSEIEHSIPRTGPVKDATILWIDHDKYNTQLVGSIPVQRGVPMLNENLDDAEESQHVESWIEMFDSEVYSTIHDIRPENIGHDFTGWTSMYNGIEIDKVDMNEWLDDTIATVLNGHRPSRVLEIGSGTGMVLFNLGNDLQSYVGIDPSSNAIQFVEKTAKSIPALAGKVCMYQGTAVDIGQLRQPLNANLVVLNSVVQYFPSQEYLFMVIKGLLQVEGVETIFFGDVRSHALHREFLATRALHMAGGKGTKADIRRMIANLGDAEAELLVDPGFFTTLPSRLPDRIRHIEVLPKKMKATNELSCYRYAAVIHVKSQDQDDLEIRQVAHDEWIDFVARGLDPESLLQHLKIADGLSDIAVSNIPNKKTIFSRCLVDSLDGPWEDAIDEHLWVHWVQQEAQQRPSLSAIELFEIAQNTGYRVEISWNRQHSLHGGLDAIFHRRQPKNGNERLMFHFPTDHEERPSNNLSNNPLRPQSMQGTQSQSDELEVIRKEDVEKIWTWNCEVPLAFERCLHVLFEEQVLARPS